jgi:hypothetical protein
MGVGGGLPKPLFAWPAVLFARSPEESSDNVIEAVISLFEVNDSTTKLLGIVCHE